MKASALCVVAVVCACSPNPAAPDGGAHGHAHCHGGARLPVDVRNGTFSTTFQVVPVGTTRDVALPDPMLDWLDEHGWPQQHDDWHNIRRWDQGCRKSNASAFECAAAKRLADKGLWRAPKQENAPGDGYDFLVMHRHMLEGIRQAFPSHVELLRGFSTVPRTQADPENLASWRAISWSAGQLEAIAKLENIEAHLSEFESEDDLARFIQAPFIWTPQNPQQPVPGNGGLHFSLHAQWSVSGSPVELGNGRGVVYNATFWRLHGWLDDVWERYRRAKGLTADDPLYVRTMEEQCHEMVSLDEKNLIPSDSSADAGVGQESGRFATQVRPFLERSCGTCHGATAATLGLSLGGLPSSELVRGLVNVNSSQTSMPLVTPGTPERSWLYLKSAGVFDAVDCVSCKTVMPPAGGRLSMDELERLRSWIADGARAD